MTRFLPVLPGVLIVATALSLTGCASGQVAAGPSAEAASTVDSAAVPAPAARKAVAKAPRPVRVPAGVTTGYVVFDRKTGKVTTHRDVHRRFRSASVVKILIALDYLERHKGPIPAADRALLTPMLRGSDDDAATALWRRGGQGQIVKRVAAKLGLTDTGPPPAAKPGFWGYTAISALDIARVYRYLLDKAEPGVRDFILGHLRNARKCAADGFDQYFGIPRAVPRPWAVKQGWSGYGSVPPAACVQAKTASLSLVPTALAASSPLSSVSRVTRVTSGNPVDFTRPVLHTTGVIGNRLIMVVLTLQPPGASYTSSADRITRLAKNIYSSAVS